MYDYHIHTTFSQDSTIEPEEAVETAIQLGIKEIAFTDHAEFNVWRPGNMITSDLFDISAYVSKIEELRKKYSKQIQIRMGVEVGLQRQEKEQIDRFIQQNPFDFVIGSSHTIKRVDLYYKNIFQDQTKEEAYEQYFREVLEIVKVFDSYNVYGHLDLIRRYAYGEYENIELSKKELHIIRDILKVIIEKGKGIEINTSGYRYGICSTNPGIGVLRLYRQLGGEVITVGSDSHRRTHIGYRIQETYAMLRDLGYQYVTTFEKMRPKFIKI